MGSVHQILLSIGNNSDDDDLGAGTPMSGRETWMSECLGHWESSYELSSRDGVVAMTDVSQTLLLNVHGDL